MVCQRAVPGVAVVRQKILGATRCNTLQHGATWCNDLARLSNHEWTRMNTNAAGRNFLTEGAEEAEAFDAVFAFFWSEMV